MTTTLQNVAAAIKTAADAEHKAAPYLEGLLPMIPAYGVEAAAIVKAIDAALPSLVQAFNSLLQAFGGNVPAAQAALIAHLTPGKQNAAPLS